MFCVYINQTCCSRKKSLFTVNAAVTEYKKYYYSDTIYRTFD